MTTNPCTNGLLGFNAVDARKLFERLDHIHLVAIQPDAPQCAKPTGRYFGGDVESAVDWAAKSNQNGFNVYWTHNYVGPNVGTKPTKAQIQAARGAHCDLDPPKDGADWDKSLAVKKLTEDPSPPSMIIDSGNGVQAVWLLDSPLKDWTSIEVTNTAIRDKFGGDHCQNIDRLLRVPGTVNYPSRAKVARGCIPCMASWIQEDTGQRYLAQELSAAFPKVRSLQNPDPTSTDIFDQIMLITANDLELGRLCRIRDEIDHPQGQDRSADGVRLAGSMIRAGYSDTQVAGILLNPANKVSAHFLEQPDPRRAALRAINVVRKGEQTPKASIEIEPVDLWARYEEPPLPKGFLPAVIEQFAVKQGAIMGADPAGLAMAALTVCSAALTDSIMVQVKHHDPSWRECARLWTGLVGPPSRKKTPIMRLAIAPLRAIDNELMQKYLQDLARFESLKKSEQQPGERPQQKRKIIADATVEAAQEVLKGSPDGVLSEQDELSGWFGSMDKYSPGKGAQADRAFWLKSYNGGTYNVNRVSRGAVQIPNLSISLLGGIQPAPLRKLVDETVDDGLIQRLIPVILRRSEVGQDTPNDEVVIDYNNLVARLHSMRPSDRAESFILRETHPQPIHFSAEARVIRERLEHEHLKLVEALETVNPKLASHFGKYDGLFARLALLWHCIESADQPSPPAEINAETAERVAQFMQEFVRPSAIAFYAGMLGMSAGHEELMALASLIVARGLVEVKARDAQRAGQLLRHITSHQFQIMCEKLEAFGWVERHDPGQKSALPRWVVNPRVHQLFAQRGRDEAERRKAAREALNEALGL